MGSRNTVLVSNLGKLIYQKTNPGEAMSPGDNLLQNLALHFEVPDVRGNTLRNKTTRLQPRWMAPRPEEPRRLRPPLCRGRGVSGRLTRKRREAPPPSRLQRYRVVRHQAVGRSPARFFGTFGTGLGSPPKKVVSPAVSSK